jgi:hypothetical protein
MMRTYKILIILLLFCNFSKGFAQSEKDKLEVLRVNFISKEIELTANESEKFWPVYNEYNDKVKAVKRNLRQSYKRKKEPLSEADAEELHVLEIQSRQAELDLYKQYSEKIKNIIGIKKLVKLRLAEEEFKRQIINTIKEKNEPLEGK